MHPHLKFAALAVALLALSLPPTPQAQRDSSAKTQKLTTPPSPNARIDINNATLDELLKIPGITPTWAARIVRFRPYRTKLELLDHGVLPPNLYDRIKDYVIAHRDKN